MIFIKKNFNMYMLALIAGFSVITAFADDNTNTTVNDSELNNAQDEDECVQDYASEHWIDKTQANTFTGMCKTVKWFDGLFGGGKNFDDDEFGGKVVVGFKQREREGFDEKVRIRIKTKLPNLSTRANAFIGRVDEDEYIADGDQNPDGLADTAIRRRNDEEAEWVVGLGYNASKNRKKGFDYSIGAKISSGLNPYAKVRYRYNFRMPQNHFLRATQTLFWRNDRGYGTTTNLGYSYLAGNNDILEWGSSVEFTEDEDQWEWVTGSNWYHRLENDHAIVSRVFVRGEEENSESIPEYGVNLVYRRPFMRDWVFLEGLLEHRWIKETSAESREKSIGVGLQFTMEFGTVARKRARQK